LRFWQKIFLISLTVLTIAVNATAFMLIGNSHALNKQKEIESGLDEFSIIVSSFQTNVLYERYRLSADGFGRQQLQQVTREFSYQFTLDDLCIQLSGQDGVLFTNYGQEIPMEMYQDLEEGGANVLLRRDASGRMRLYISSPVVLQSERYVFTTVKDITRIYDVKNMQLRFFGLFGPAISVVVAMIMLLVSKLLTSQINRLRRSTMHVAQGQYTAIPIRSKDEVGALTEDFNRMTEAIQQKVEQLEQTAKERKDFIDNMTHEMKTPLTSIIGFSDLLRSARLDDETVHDYAESIYKEGQYLKTISSKLMDLILLRQAPDMKDVDVTDLVAEIAAAVEPIANSRGMRFVATAEPFPLVGERELLRSLFYNLIDNAIKASAPGAEIALCARMSNGVGEIAVHDQGSGIPKGEIKRIFQPFYRLDKARSRSMGGAGLGLALCAEIAKVHRAELIVDSAPGVGTTVIVRFNGKGGDNA
jgi:signal transduction histidine kinase